MTSDDTARRFALDELTELEPPPDADAGDAIELPAPANSNPLPEGSAKPRQRRGDPNAKPTPRHKLKKVSLQIPEYVWDELHQRAHKQRCSMRHVIMKALRSNGITINEPDMIEDGRKLR